MRKLFLTSFRFRTGEIDYHEQRLVVVTDGDTQEAELSIAYDKAKAYFKDFFPESELHSIIVHPAIEGYDSVKKIEGNWIPEFFENNRLPMPMEHDNSRSKDVLIDLTGWRLNFRVGFFSYSEMKWSLYDKEAEKLIDLEGLHWTELPLNDGKV